MKTKTFKSSPYENINVFVFVHTFSTTPYLREEFNLTTLKRFTVTNDIFSSSRRSKTIPKYKEQMTNSCLRETCTYPWLSLLDCLWRCVPERFGRRKCTWPGPTIFPRSRWSTCRWETLSACGWSEVACYLYEMVLTR